MGSVRYVVLFGRRKTRLRAFAHAGTKGTNRVVLDRGWVEGRLSIWRAYRVGRGSVEEGMATQSRIDPFRWIPTRLLPMARSHGEALLTVSSVAALSVSKATVYKLVREREISCLRVGNAIRFEARHVREFLSARIKT